MQSKHVKVHYFDIYGRGEILRFILSHNKIHYEDIRYDFSSWIELKNTGKFLFGQLPAVEIDGKIYEQSYDVARYLTMLFNQYPLDINDSYYVELTKDYIEDVLIRFIPWFAEQDAEKKEADT